jgi:hypothetical protein
MKTLAAAYAAQQALNQQLLKRLETALATHADAAAAKPKNWGYLGDLTATTGRLIEALSSLDALTAEERAKHRV